MVMLDEPSAGLDPVSRRNLWDTLIQTMAKRSVVLTTHSMEEAEALCTRIGIMVKGQVRIGQGRRAEGVEAMSAPCVMMHREGVRE